MKRAAIIILLISFVLSAAAVLINTNRAFADTCMQDRYFSETKGKLNCTANDVRIARAINIRDLAGKAMDSCVSGQYFSFVADFEVRTTATARYDIGLYFGTDGDPNGDGAYTGTCDVNIITPIDSEGFGSANFINLDPAPDICGDITTGKNPQIVTVRVSDVLCVAGKNNNLKLPNCVSWRQTGANKVCTSELDTYPGSPSKCNCDREFTVGIRVEEGKLKVVKDVSPDSRPEPGGEFTFFVTATNTGNYQPVTVERICDDRFGTVAKIPAAPDCPAGDLGSIKETNCSLPQTLAAKGGYFACSFKADIISGSPITVTDVVTVYGKDGNVPPKDIVESDSAQVQITDVPPTATVVKSQLGIECAEVKYRVKVTNTSDAEPLTLTGLSDSAFGNITIAQNAVKNTTCSTPQTIGIDEYYQCEFTARFCGGSHTNTVTATLRDDENETTQPESNSLKVTVEAK